MSDTPREEPLPCPFCGFNAAEETVVDTNEGVAYAPWYAAQCVKCGFQMDGARDFAEAMAQWNRRALPPPRPAEPTNWRDELYALAGMPCVNGKGTDDLSCHEECVTCLARREVERLAAPLPSGEPTGEAVAWYVGVAKHPEDFGGFPRPEKVDVARGVWSFDGPTWICDCTDFQTANDMVEGHNRQLLSAASLPLDAGRPPAVPEKPQEAVAWIVSVGDEHDLYGEWRAAEHHANCLRAGGYTGVSISPLYAHPVSPALVGDEASRPEQSPDVQASLDDLAAQGVRVNTRGCDPMSEETVDALRAVVDAAKQMPREGPVAKTLGAAVGVSMGAPAGPMDWAEDFDHENGQYQCRCVNCGCLFVGHKRRVTCRMCSVPAPRLAEVEVAIERLRAEAYEDGVHRLSFVGGETLDARAALLALLGPAGVPAHEPAVIEGDAEPIICWVGTTTFRRSRPYDTPVLGTMGSSARRVVVMDAEDFGELAKRVPTQRFNLGDIDGFK